MSSLGISEREKCIHQASEKKASPRIEEIPIGGRGQVGGMFEGWMNRRKGKQDFSLGQGDT